MNTMTTPTSWRFLCTMTAALLLAGCASLQAPDADKEAPSPVEDASATAVNRDAQAPGFFRMRLGAVTVTSLYDGNFDINSKLFKGRPQASINKLLKDAKQPVDVPTATNAFLLDDGKNIVLIDAGAGSMLGASTGRLLQSLAASGYTPSDVTAILLTHLHPDHAGGLAEEDTAVFPNAHIHVPEAEAQYWLSDTRLSAGQPYFQGTRKLLLKYQAENRFHTFAKGASPVPGVDSVALPGHTPGHTGYFIHSNGDSLLIWGDIVHNLATQFPDPLISLEFDVDQKSARATRAKAMRNAAQTGIWIAGSHLPFPGIGRVQAAGKTSYRWLPIEYSQALSAPAQRQPASP
ncbi:ribonuclease Z [Delftia tsuruhatensis]|uniref:MBL fold metallo-hydrolase n=1 Tax=Delftia tsuruhatensis TaxID=180282 RepID=UPI001E78F21C|nr:MBL fold metallo-hydrolase [Delftia tsuruhatensis]CAB5709972.1 ribonuclease Z [Delftia tsuruhatensis]CAC9685100.1 ribonuclease Z [Delftia tsuruhatensis]